MKKLLFLAFAICLSSACSDEDETGSSETYEVISFESSERMIDLVRGGTVNLTDLKMSLYDIGEYVFRNVYCGKDYVSAADKADFDGPLFATADGRVRFCSYYSCDYDVWGGIALAQSADRSAAASALTQQFSVWAEGGANGTQTFAVLYDSNSPSEEYPDFLTRSGYPTIELTEPCVVDHFYIANSTLVYNFFQGDEAQKYQVKITGWLDGAEKGSLTETLVAGKSKLDGWRKVNLAAFGTVDKVVFKVICDYATEPAYFCIDEIMLKRSADR